MVKRKSVNPPHVVGWILALIIFSFLAITWSLILIISVYDTLVLLGLDFINALALLSGITILPSNIHLFFCITSNDKISSVTQVLFCPLWINLCWCLNINVMGLVLTLLKLYNCQESVPEYLKLGMHQYRTNPTQKHFVDNLQWYMKCCGLKSYRDWFSYDWYDKIRDYEWDSFREKRLSQEAQAPKNVDSVPQSCCKSGSCISNYLSELGTFFINTKGCKDPVYRFLMIYLILYIVYFSIVILLEIFVLRFSLKPNYKDDLCVRHIMNVKDNFQQSSESYSALLPDESD